MAGSAKVVNSHLRGLKVNVKLVKGSVTVSKLDTAATDENLKKFAGAVGALCLEETENVYKVETFELLG